MKRCLLLLLLLGACTRSPQIKLYTLVPGPGTSYPIESSLQVRRPTVAGYLDRREIVRGIRDQHLELAADANWAEPLDAMFGRVLAANLALRLPRSRVFTDLNTLSAVPEVSIDSELQRFERGEDGLVLRVLIALRRTGQLSPVALQTVELKHASGSSTDDVVASMDTLLAQLADRIASMVASDPSR